MSDARRDREQDDLTAKCEQLEQENQLLRSLLKRHGIAIPTAETSPATSSPPRPSALNTPQKDRTFSIAVLPHRPCRLRCPPRHIRNCVATRPCRLDTNILLYLTNPVAGNNAPTKAAVTRLLASDDRLVVFVQVLFEFWSVATRPVAANGFGGPTKSAPSVAGSPCSTSLQLGRSLAGHHASQRHHPSVDQTMLPILPLRLVSRFCPPRTEERWFGAIARDGLQSGTNGRHSMRAALLPPLSIYQLPCQARSFGPSASLSGQ